MTDNIDKLWLKSYQSGVPAEINPDDYTSIVAILEEAMQKYQNNPAFTNMGVAMSYNQVDELTQRFAGFLQHTCKMQAGERVAIMLPNVLQYPIAMFGSMRAKMTIVNVNPLYTATELKRVLIDSGASCIVVLENFAHVVQAVLPETKVRHIVVTKMGDQLGFLKGHIVNFVVKHVKKMVPAWDIAGAFEFHETIVEHNKQYFVKPSIQGADIAYLQYTGGTTGGIKGAMLTHRNMVANLLQATAWIKDLTTQKLHGGIITALPLYHIFSLTANCLTFFRLGLPNILVTNPRDIPGFVKILKKEPYSVITGVNTLFNALLNNDDFRQLDFSNLRFVLGGGMAVQHSVASRWYEVTKVVLLEAYGLTEASPAVTINPLNLKEFNGSIGLPISSTDIKICDEQGNSVSVGEPGELLVRGPQVMKGYWNQPEETANVLIDGWLHTGDVAKLNEAGFVFIVDRKKDVIIVSGFNVYPNEVEDVIAQMKEVREVAIVGVYAEDQGEIIKAFIVRKDPNLTPDHIIQHCRQYLTGYKIPKEIEFRNELPKTNVGKVLRRQLREEEEKKRRE